MILPPFAYHHPSTVEEALAIAREAGGDFDYVAGGSDLLQNYKNRLNPRGHLISVSGIDEMRGASDERIGALTLLADLERDPSPVPAHPAIARAASVVASPLVRQQATVGGNLLVETRCFYFNQSEFWRRSVGYCMKADGDVCLVVPQKERCYATYSGDLAPVMMVLDATYHLAGFDGRRAVPARAFYGGDGIERNVKRPEEILTHVTLPAASRGLRADYRKLRVRDAFDYPMMGVAASLRLEGDAVAELHVVVNAVDTRPLPFEEYTSALAGRRFDEAFIEEVSREVMARCRPVKNLVLSTAYRKKMVGVFLARILRGFAGREQALPVAAA
jgi:4-hydroxybenzoyl-CoA reductase subunit beta